MSYVVLTVLEACMDTNDEVRRRRLLALGRLTPGGLAAVAEIADVSWENLDQIIKKTLLPPRKSDKVRSPKALSDVFARKIEKAHGLAPGWLDWPFEAVNYEIYAKLSDLDKGALQGLMQEQLRRLVLDGAKVERVSTSRIVTCVNDGKSHHTQVHGERTIEPNALKNNGLEPALRGKFRRMEGDSDEVDKPGKVQKQQRARS